MTDDQTTSEEDEPEADGFVLVHMPTEESLPYGVGPFPPFADLAMELIAKAACDCAISVLWVRFPGGIRMMVEAPALDKEEIAEIVTEAVAEVIRTRKEASHDRLN